MKKFYNFIFLTLSIFLWCNQSNAQKRYVDQIFDEVTVSPLMGYGQNYTVLPLVTPGAHTLKQPLAFQMYTPVGDTETNRPLIIYLHTGNFFPYPANGSCGGRLNDPSNVEVATRLAKMGYAVAVCDYRQGWNPLASDELIRRFTLINAAYRGVQDTRTAIRYFKRTVAEFGNPFGIDGSKIVVWGQGTGGYLSLATAYLNDYLDILNTSDPDKFKLGGVPMVIPQYNGDIYGTSGPHIVDALYNASTGIPLGDTLGISNHEGYSSDFNLAVNMGGALGDSLWVSEGEIPLISFHVPTDPFAPCETDVLNVPTATGPQPVVEVTGSCGVSKIVQRFGLNDVFNDIPADKDPYGQAALDAGGANGFFPFNNTPNNTSSPWEWMYPDDMPNPAAGCNFDAIYPQAYLDTIIGYFAPRACISLGLDCFSTGTTETDLSADVMTLSPNPTQSELNIDAKDRIIENIAIFGIEGKLYAKIDVNSSTFTFRRDNLPSGIYFVKAFFADGVATQRVVFE